MPDYNTIHAKTEQAVAAWLATQSIGTSNIYTGRRSLTKSAPCVIVYAEKSKERPTGSGNSDVKIKVMVKSTMGDSTELELAHNTLVAKTFDAMFATDPANPNYFAEQISALVENFTCFGNGKDMPSESESGTPENESDCWQDTLDRVLYCAPSDIS